MNIGRLRDAMSALSVVHFQEFLIWAALSRDGRVDQVAGLGHGFTAIRVTLSQSKQIFIMRVESRTVWSSPSVPLPPAL